MSDTKQQCPTNALIPYVRHLPNCGAGCSVSDALALQSWESTKNKWRDCTCGLANTMRIESIGNDSPVEGSGEPTSSGSGILEPHKDLTVAAEGQGSNRGAALPDSPSAAGSGAREWLEANCDYDDFDDDVTISRYQGHGTVEQDIPTIMESYADHCTAPLREQLDTALASADFWERELNNFRRNAAHRAEQLAAEMVTAERTRREAAEKQLDYIAKVCAKAESNFAHETACRLSWQGRAEAAERELKRIRDGINYALENCFHHDLRVAIMTVIAEREDAALRGKGE